MRRSTHPLFSPAAMALVLAAAAWTTLPALAAAPNARSLQQADRLTRSGMQALQEGDLAKATSLFEKALKAVDYFPDAYVGLGHAAMARHEYEAARLDFEKARENYPRMGGELVQLRARKYAEAQKEINALRDGLRQLDQMQPPTTEAATDVPAEVDYYLGNALFQLDRKEDAVAAWENALETNPKLPGVNANLAVGYAMLGRMDEARTAVARAEEVGDKVDPRLEADLEKSAGQ